MCASTSSPWRDTRRPTPARTSSTAGRGVAGAGVRREGHSAAASVFAGCCEQPRLVDRREDGAGNGIRVDAGVHELTARQTGEGSSWLPLRRRLAGRDAHVSVCRSSLFRTHWPDLSASVRYVPLLGAILAAERDTERSIRLRTPRVLELVCLHVNAQPRARNCTVCLHTHS